MGKSVRAMKAALFALAESNRICDPLTGCFPTDEKALSGLLCLHAQRGEVRWDKVSLYDVRSFQKKGHAADLISHSGAFLSEYLLLHHNKSEESIWGGMSADLLYASLDFTSVVLFENKIGSKLEYGRNPKSNQLARQLDYLLRLHDRSNRNVSLVLISIRELFEKGWYREEFVGALEHNDRSSKVSGYLMTWEDLLGAMVS